MRITVLAVVLLLAACGGPDPSPAVTSRAQAQIMETLRGGGHGHHRDPAPVCPPDPACALLPENQAKLAENQATLAGLASRQDQIEQRIAALQLLCAR